MILQRYFVMIVPLAGSLLVIMFTVTINDLGGETQYHRTVDYRQIKGRLSPDFPDFRPGTMVTGIEN